MNRLTKGCFGHQFQKITVPGFEFLTCGQIRTHENFGHNAGWYNKNGEKIGWGDLSKKDVQNIQKALQDGELFITVSEHDSFWNFVREFGSIGSMCRTTIDEQAPGIDYVSEKSRFIIAHNELFANAVEFWIKPGEKKEVDGIQFTGLEINEIKKLMQNY
jgi:hypothetical protein